MFKRNRFIYIPLLILLTAVFFCSCEDSAKTIIKNAEEHKKIESKIFIGFIGPWHSYDKEYDLWPGIALTWVV